VIAGLLGIIVNSNVLPQRLLAAIAPWWTIVVIALGIVWLLPRVFRRRG
jgi:hypothetical protein